MTDLAGAATTVLRSAAGADLAGALVGGLAVSIRTEPRFTRDVDLAVAVDDDAQAEGLLALLRASGHEIAAVSQQVAVGRLATARVRMAGGDIVDLLFASSGIEPDLVRRSHSLEVLPGAVLPVAVTGDLIALKVLARDDVARPQDVADLRALLAVSDDEDLALARSGVAAIVERGFGRGRDLAADLDRVVREFRPK